MCAALAWGPLAITSAVQAEEPTVQQDELAELQAKFDAVQRQVDAYRSGDINKFVATFSRDATVRGDEVVAVGHAQIRELYQYNFMPGAPQVRIHDSYLKDGKVVMHAGYVFSDGQEQCCSISEYEVTNGKVSDVRVSM